MPRKTQAQRAWQRTVKRVKAGEMRVSAGTRVDLKTKRKAR